MVELIFLAIGIYLVGVGACFMMGSMQRDGATISIEIRSRDTYGESEYGRQQLEKAQAEHAEGCRLQLRAPLWPIVFVGWVKNQIITAFIGANGGGRDDRSV